MLSAANHAAMAPVMGTCFTPKATVLPARRPVVCRQRSTSRLVARAEKDSYEVLTLQHAQNRSNWVPTGTLPDRVQDLQAVSGLPCV